MQVTIDRGILGSSVHPLSRNVAASNFQVSSWFFRPSTTLRCLSPHGNERKNHHAVDRVSRDSHVFSPHRLLDKFAYQGETARGLESGESLSTQSLSFESQRARAPS